MPGFLDWLAIPAGRVPRIASHLAWRDHLGACLARWGIGRMSYLVPPGLYAIGQPTAAAPVIVTANYKMTYDIVRRALDGCDIWLLVLETYGINVWCAAGKGTFGTDELVRRVEASGLARVVSHRRLILPILGAAGVAAHQVARRCGFTVSYAAIRATDLPEYLRNGMVTTPTMRTLTFSLYERLVLIPVEVVLQLKTLAVTSALVMLAGALAGNFALALTALGAFLGATFCGLVAGPLLLPWLPGKSFAVKGLAVGLLWTLFFYAWSGGDWSPLATAAALFLLPAVSAYHTLNFTGCTPFTSRSGVKKELRLGLPAMVAALALGGLLLVLNRFSPM